MSDTEYLNPEKGFIQAMHEYIETEGISGKKMALLEQTKVSLESLKEEMRTTGVSQQLVAKINNILHEDNETLALEHFTSRPSSNNQRLAMDKLDEAMESTNYLLLGVLVAATLAAIFLIYKLIKYISQVIRETKSMSDRATSTAEKTLKNEEKLEKDTSTEKAIYIARTKFYAQFDKPEDARDPRFVNIDKRYTSLLNYVFCENDQNVLKSIAAATNSYGKLKLETEKLLLALEGLVKLYQDAHGAPDINFESGLESMDDTIDEVIKEYERTLRTNAENAFVGLLAHKENKVPLTSDKLKQIEKNILNKTNFAFMERMHDTSILSIKDNTFDGEELIKRAEKVIESEKKIADEANMYPDAAKTRASMSKGVRILKEIVSFFAKLLGMIQKLQTDFSFFVMELDKLYDLRGYLVMKLAKRVKEQGKDPQNQKLHHLADKIIQSK